MSGRWPSRYTEQQREALGYAYVDQHIRPAKHVVQLAAEGALRLNGEPVGPFETNENTVRDEARKLKKRRAGQVDSQLATLPPRDAIETLRRRLVNVADGELAALERAKPGTRDLERMRQVARAIFEAARIPGPSDPRPATRDTKDPATGTRTGVDTKGGLAGTLLKAHRSNGQGPAEDRPSKDASAPSTEDGEHTARSTAANAPNTEQQDGQPGSWARKQTAVLLGQD